MKKRWYLPIFFMMILFLPLWGMAQETNPASSTVASSGTGDPFMLLGNPSTLVWVDIFYWGTRVRTPNYSLNTPSIGGELNVKLDDFGLKNLGFEVEYTQTNTGPRFVNTNGQCTNSFAGFIGYPVPFGNTGLCGMDSRGEMQFGGGKIKYFVPNPLPGLQLSVYANYFSVTGGRSDWGGGLEAYWKLIDNFSIDAFADYGNVSGNSFPNQNLFRYQADLQYQFMNLPELYLLAGYREYDFSRFYNTTVSGYMIGVGTRF
jgi:hypothetical protein